MLFQFDETHHVVQNRTTGFSQCSPSDLNPSSDFIEKSKTNKTGTFSVLTLNRVMVVLKSRKPIILQVFSDPQLRDL